MVEKTLLEFIGGLREAGIQVTLSESMDALRALEAVPLSSLGVLHATLRTPLVKNEADYPVFDAVFERFFLAPATPVPIPETPDSPAATIVSLSRSELFDLFAEVMASGSDDDIAALAMATAVAVGMMEGDFGGGSSRPVARMAGPRYYVFRAMEWLDFREITAVLEEMAAAGDLVPGRPPVLALEELRERLEKYRAALEREIARRYSISRGKPVEGRRKIPPRPEEIDFTTATLKQVEDMRRVLPVLARRLAARLARKRSAGKPGRVDVRNTLRHSISSGGVPVDVKYRRRVPSRPELFVLCDVSGSVRTFSTFTLQLVYSLHQQFSYVRSFAFVDRVDEVSELFNSYDVEEAVGRTFREAEVVDGDGHSDVGRAIELFYESYFTEVTPRSTVLVLSDARNNGRDPRSWALEKIHEKVRRLYWLNPEPVERWNSGDSIIGEYEQFCHSVHECRNLKQLSDFVYRGA